jgi:hypothetical protein
MIDLKSNYNLFQKQYFVIASREAAKQSHKNKWRQRLLRREELTPRIDGAEST